MNGSDEKFFKKLLATFKEEANEHINVISAGLLELEKNPVLEVKNNIIEKIFREAHSLKGAARSVNISEIETICGSLESVFNAFKKNEIEPSPDIFDTLYITTNFLTKLLQAIEPPAEKSESEAAHRQAVKLQTILDSIVTDNKSQKESSADNEQITQSSQKPEGLSEFSSGSKDFYLPGDKIRVPARKMDEILSQAEEFLSAKLSIKEHIDELQSFTNLLVEWKKEREKISRYLSPTGYKHKSTEKLQKNVEPIYNNFEKVIEFLKWNDNYIKTFERNLIPIIKSLKQQHHSFSIMLDSMLDDMKKILMQPVSTILNVFPRVVRELAHNQNKKVELIITGSEIEIDRRILEELKNPMNHLLRNCIDHGIEKPDVRLNNNKSEKGLVRIDVTQKENNKVEIQISDDGSGINLKKVIDSAVKLGFITEDEKEKLSNEQTLSLLFLSGVTSSSIITDLSGRGLGLAIVREKVDNLGGNIYVETNEGIGSKFIIQLPLTLATFRGVFVRLGSDTFVIPTSYIEKAARIKQEEIKTVENKDTINLFGRVVSFIGLSDALGITKNNNQPEINNGYMQVVVLADSNTRIAFSVDEILGEQEILVKSFGRQLQQTKNISGATILGDGRVVPIINVSELLKSTVTSSSEIISRTSVKKESEKRRMILVVEDSITSRTLLKNILETAGYDVATAVDGIDAFTKLRSANFNLVVSDVDMPRMNGFDLTAKIRSEKKTAEIPVILVTALESKEDRERGIDVGANAYIVKSSFDQRNLLEIIRQLI